MKGGFTLLITYNLKPDEELTPEQIRMIEEAAKRPIEFDEDCPETTPDQAKKFYRVRSGEQPGKQSAGR